MNNELTLLFKALSHPIRREILDLLKQASQTTGQLAERFPDLSRYAVMKHLSLLEKANLVLVRREGKYRVNFLNAVPLQELYDRWVGQYESKLAGSLVMLRDNLHQAHSEKGESNHMEQASPGKESTTFRIEQEIVIQAPREKVFEALTQDVQSWWQYRLAPAGVKSTLQLKPELGGTFIETWGDHQGALWGTVYYIHAPVEIRLQGHLGMKGAVNSSYIYQLEEKGDATVLKLSHTASGYIEDGWKESHEHGWQELLGKFLKDYVEQGQ
ncbi:helix-turn-helix domain-containing protein [Brevibacillus dissolubilis]|uniref:helix-turn-helix domain-containing protein n=1 Tax=Brevibacillus dissolubilis TaxID=1844116 RepID=UPI001116B5B3|nr:helix-turn-helix domain-containing protein [Brevibacillus dissolubilis]